MGMSILCDTEYKYYLITSNSFRNYHFEFINTRSLDSARDDESIVISSESRFNREKSRNLDFSNQNGV